LELYPVNQLDVIDVCPLRHVLMLLGLAGADLQSLTAAALLAAVRRSSPQLLTAIEQQQQQQCVTGHVTPSPAQPQQPDAAVHATPSPAAAGGASDASMAVTTQVDSTPIQPNAAAAAAAAAAEGTGHAEAGNAGADAAAAPAAAAAAATPVGFLAALSDYLAEQQQPQQQPWLLPIDTAALSPPGVSTTPIDSNTPPAAACAGPAEANLAEAAVAAAAEVMAGDAQAAGPAAEPDAAAAAGLPGTGDQAAAAIRQPEDQQQQQLAAVQSGLQRTLQQQHQQQRLPVLPSIEVLPCDWASALAAAGPPASKREMISLAGLNPAAALPAPLLPLLLPALARVVLLLHRWLLLGQQHSQQLADAATAAVVVGSGTAAGGAGSSAAAAAGSTGSTDCGQLEELLVQLGTIEQLQAVPPEGVNIPQDLTSAAASEVASSSSSSSRSVQANNAGRTATFNSSSSSSSMVHASGCRCLLLSGHGAAGQSELAAAVLQLLGAASAAAVHSVSLPAMLLAGDGDVSRGLVCAVREAVARTGRGQLLVLYLPRIEVGCRVGL
jgi:hypothetical protein